MLIRHLNAFASVVSAGWAVAAVIRPGILSRSKVIAESETFYARMYAARATPLGIATAVLPYRARGSAAAATLYTAALIQVVDVLIAMGRNERGMAVGATIGAIVHLLCGITVVE